MGQNEVPWIQRTAANYQPTNEFNDSNMGPTDSPVGGWMLMLNYHLTMGKGFEFEFELSTLTEPYGARVSLNNLSQIQKVFSIKKKHF